MYLSCINLDYDFNVYIYLHVYVITYKISNLININNFLLKNNKEKYV